jgi:hypothetical protein
MKLTLILLLLITSLMAVVGAFLTTSVSSFYIDTFYQQINSVFGEEQDSFVADLRNSATSPDGAERLKEMWISVPVSWVSITRRETILCWMEQRVNIWSDLQRQQNCRGNRVQICSQHEML